MILKANFSKAWTESSGRVGIADVRTLFNSRQLILINSNSEDVERITLSDYSIHRRNLRTESPSGTPDYLGLGSERQQLRRLERQRLGSLTRELLDRHQEPPTSAELDVLEVSRIARRQRDAANAAREVLAESSAASSSRWDAASRLGPWATEGRRTPTGSGNGEGSSSATSRLVSNSGLPTSLRDFVSHDRSAASFRTFMDERNRESARRLIQQREPRGSLFIPEAEMTIERVNQAQNPSLTITRNDDTFSGLENLSLIIGRRDRERELEGERYRPTPDPDRAPDSGMPWTDIESVYRIALDTGGGRPARIRVGIGEDENVGVNPREFAHRLRQPWRPTDDGTTLGLGALSRDESGLLDGVLRAADTMGCCWSPDGRIL